MAVRVRFAPSPTGFLHVGGARTALFNDLFAKKNQGQFILRIEDTDQQRHQEEAIASIVKSLTWLGLTWDEGVYLHKNKVISKGPHGPYRQSERLSIYKQKAQELIEKGQAYYCFLSEEEESQIKQQALKQGKVYRPTSPFRDLSLKEALQKIEQGASPCVRFKNSLKPQDYRIDDLVRGQVTFSSETVGDFILLRSDSYPVYSFSCAIDDALMKITHVFRGEEHLPNTLKQILIHKALNVPTPQTGHLSIILGEDKKKLSKRTGAQSVEHFQQEGYMPEGLANFLALLGWNPGTEQECFSSEELVKAFSTKGLNLSAAVFDQNKLLWLNTEHLKKLNNKKLWEKISPFLKEQNIVIQKDWKEMDSILEALKHNFKTFKQAVDILKHFASDESRFVITQEANPILKWPQSQKVIQEWKSCLENNKNDFITLEEFKAIQKNIQSQHKVKGKELFMPLRCAVLGQPEGIEIKILATLLERKELIKRASKVLNAF